VCGAGGESGGAAGLQQEEEAVGQGQGGADRGCDGCRGRGGASGGAGGDEHRGGGQCCAADGRAGEGQTREIRYQNSRCEGDACRS